MKPEAALHRAVAQYLSLVLPQGCGVFFSTFPSGGGGRIRGAQLKAMGLKSGVPDLMLIHEGRYYGIELKAGTALSVAQHERRDEIHQAGGQVAVARSIDQVKEHLSRWGILPRGSVVEQAARMSA